MGGARYWIGAVGDFSQANATEVRGRVRFPNNNPLEEAAAQGDAGFGELAIEDATGDLHLRSWMPFWVNEDDCADPRIWTGFIYGYSETRGPSDIVDGHRIVTAKLIDLNGLLKLRVIRGASGKRPVETTQARLDWLLGDVLVNVVWDNGWIDVPTVNRDEADFRGQYAADVLSAMCSDGAFDAYVIWDQNATVGHEISLVVEPTDSGQRTSVLKLSNVLADIDLATVYPPSEDSTLDIDGSEIYSGVLLRWAGGENYYSRTATDTTYFGTKYGRDWVEDEQRIGRQATADSVAATLLEKHALPKQTINTRVILPASKVNLIRAGHLLSVKYSHFDGFTSYTTTKVKRRGVLEKGHDDSHLYELALELSTQLSVSGGGGGPGGGGTPLPPPTPTTPAIVQTGPCHPATSGFGGEPDYVAAYLSSAPTAGNIVVAGLVIREGSSIAVDSGWTVIGNTSSTGSGGEAAFRVMLLYRTVIGGDTGTYRVSQNITNVSYRSSAIEFTGIAAPPVSAIYAIQHGTSAAMAIADQGGVTVSVHMIDWVNTLGTPPGFTEDCSGLSSNGANIAPKMMFAHAFGGTDSIMSIGEGGANWGGVIASFSASSSGASANPPRTGQPVGTGESPEFVATGDGVTNQFTTDWPFATGSLHVMVDRQDQTGTVIATNPASGSFSLAFAPKPGEKIEVWYLGR